MFIYECLCHGNAEYDRFEQNQHCYIMSPLIGICLYLQLVLKIRFVTNVILNSLSSTKTAMLLPQSLNAASAFLPPCHQIGKGFMTKHHSRKQMIALNSHSGGKKLAVQTTE